MKISLVVLTIVITPSIRALTVEVSIMKFTRHAVIIAISLPSLLRSTTTEDTVMEKIRLLVVRRTMFSP